MELPKSVNVVVLVNDKKVEPAKDDGGLGRLSPGRVKLLLSQPKGSATYAIKVDKSNNVSIMRDRSKEFGSLMEHRSVYRLVVPVHQAGDDCYTRYPDRHFRLVFLLENGLIQFWEFACVSQDNLGFVTCQHTVDVKCFRDGDKVVCPDFSNWPEGTAFLRNIMRERVNTLAPVEHYAVPPTMDKTPREPNHGIVLWYNWARQYGAIATNQGNARVHWSAINGQPIEWRHLIAGQLVSFESIGAPKSDPKHPTRFNIEVKGVRVV